MYWTLIIHPVKSFTWSLEGCILPSLVSFTESLNNSQARHRAAMGKESISTGRQEIKRILGGYRVFCSTPKSKPAYDKLV